MWSRLSSSTMGSVAASLVSMKPSSTSITSEVGWGTSEVGWRTSEVVRIASEVARLTPLSPRPSSDASQSKEVSRRPECRCLVVAVVVLF